MQKAVAIIPARFKSSRFPGKPLATLNGKLIIQRVFEQASAACRIDSVCVATDDEKIFDAVASFGGNAVMTSAHHESGTDRIAEAAGAIDCDFVINVQGDEPFIKPEMIDDVVNLLCSDEKAAISTLAKKITAKDEVLSPNIVKVVFDNNGYALYFSRAPIPYHRDDWAELSNITYVPDHTEVFKHIGIYGYRKDVLMEFSRLKPHRLETTEKLEQLRALTCGMRIKVKETEHDTFGIDTLEDLRKAEEWQNTFS